jgi:hypothetical protein
MIPPSKASSYKIWRMNTRSTSEGLEITIYPVSLEKWTKTVIHFIWVSIVSAAVYFTFPALKTYFETGQITGALKLLERFELSPRGIKIAVGAFCIFILWWGLGALYEIIKIQLRRDRFLIRSDRLLVERRFLYIRKIELTSYGQMALRLRPFDGALEAKTVDKSQVLTDLGTSEEREQLLQTLNQYYRAPQELPIIGQSAKETVATYTVVRQPDGLVTITASQISRIGCAISAAVVCTILIGVAVWSLTRGSGGGVIAFIFMLPIAFAGLQALNRRRLEASPGRIRMSWSSPVGKIISRFGSFEKNLAFQKLFGEGTFEADHGTLLLRIVARQKSAGSDCSIVLFQPVEQESDEEAIEDNGRLDDEEEDTEFLDEAKDEPEEEYGTRTTLLEVSGNSEESAKYLFRLLAETTGFPTKV